MRVVLLQYTVLHQLLPVPVERHLRRRGSNVPRSELWQHIIEGDVVGPG